MNTDAIIKALRETYDDTDKVYFSLRTILKDAADTIETLVAQRDEARKDCAVAEKNHMDADFELSALKSEKSHWIDPKKRLPISGESVVVILDTGDVQEAFYSTKSNAWIKDTGFMVIPEVIYWMPFPEPKY